jgi:hypothetical protein
LCNIRALYDIELKNYFRLAVLARSQSATRAVANEASGLLFSTRVALETSIEKSILNTSKNKDSITEPFFKANFYGSSKKQGISLRMPLSTCLPTKLCAAACYAHDALDAAPAAVVRGAVNGAIANVFENGNQKIRKNILKKIMPHTKKAVRAAISEVGKLQNNWFRRPSIRFAHVGELARFPHFANSLAAQVIETSKGTVSCVIYTRHKRAIELDPSLWVINFTLDKDSLERRSWAAPHMRIVFAAFGGELNQTAEINFLEHHRWSHAMPIGEGSICPATAPEANERTCDAVFCDKCFKNVVND